MITQLRQEMNHLSERDNAALAERTAMMEQLGVVAPFGERSRRAAACGH